MNELPCEVVRDLLPSYVDGLTSKVTGELVEEHIGTCAPCRAALDAMRAPEAETEKAGKMREIDYLKKNKRRNRAVVLWSIAGALALAFTVIFMRMFVIGEELRGSAVLRDIQIEENRLAAKIDCVDSARVVKAVYYEEKDGVVTLRAQGVLASFLHGPGAQAVYTASAPIRQVRMGERIYWDDGAAISAYVSDVYATRHEYVGDMSANGGTAVALGMAGYLREYTNVLHTSNRPYVWRINISAQIPATDRTQKERDLTSFACVLLAMIGNLDEVRFAYTVDGAAAELAVTADDATALFGQDVKECFDSPRLLSELMNRLSLKI